MIGVIIPVYNRYDLTHARLLELYKYIPGDIEIIIVDDASPEEKEIKGGLGWWQKQVNKHPIRYYRNPENLGFGGTCNVGADIAIKNGAEILVFLSNDVYVQGNFIDEIKNKIAQRENILIGGQIIDFRSGWNDVRFNGHTMIVPYAAGWLVACTVRVWETLGGFDPIYGRFDYEDMDLSTTALSLGIGLVGLNLPYLRHYSGATIATLPINRENQTILNKQRYLNKWEGRWSEIYKALEARNG